MALDKEGIILWVDSACDVLRELRESPFAQLCGILPRCYGVHVDNRVVAIEFFR
jgi:hypothetical protein